MNGQQAEDRKNIYSTELFYKKIIYMRLSKIKSTLHVTLNKAKCIKLIETSVARNNSPEQTQQVCFDTLAACNCFFAVFLTIPLYITV